MLRRNLALWKPRETIEETVRFCKEVGVGEIIWKVDAEAFNHGFTPLALIERFLPWLAEARDRGAREGIVFSINPWVTLNHAGRARYPEGAPAGWHWRVRPTGEEALERACPLAPGWQEWVAEAYRLFATTKPDKLWLEDDFKTFVDNGSELGCFCEAHLEAFGELAGERMGREELVTRMTAPGKPDPIRGKWFEFQGGIMVEACRRIEKAVHGASRETRLGLMQSWSTDGRWWSEAMSALAGGLRPLARTSLAPYHEGGATIFLPDEFDVLKETACLPANTENCPELENSLYTPYSKSMRTTRLQIILSQLLGNRAITMNLFDMVGSPTSEDPRAGAMLKELKPFIDGIAGVAGAGGTSRGVSVPFPKRYADSVHVKAGQGFSAFPFDGEGWMLPLQGSGVPVFLNGESRVRALTGQSVRGLDAEEIGRILSGGALLDGSAAAVLCEMGYGERIGVTVGGCVRHDTVLISAERDDEAGAAEGDPTYLPLRGPVRDGVTQVHKLTPVDGARVVSCFVDNEHKEVMPGMVLFENASGGRVATYALDLSPKTTPGFMSWRRRRQVQRVVRWLGRDEVDLFVDGGGWMMPVRRDYEGYTLLAALNFETDGWEEVALTFSWDGSGEDVRFEVLERTGRFEAIAPAAVKRDGVNVVARFNRAVAALDGLVFRATGDKD